MLAPFAGTNHAFAIDPIYEGANGIREKVFATDCLVCHSSNLTGPDRILTALYLQLIGIPRVNDTEYFSRHRKSRGSDDDAVLF